MWKSVLILKEILLIELCSLTENILSTFPLFLVINESQFLRPEVQLIELYHRDGVQVNH